MPVLLQKIVSASWDGMKTGPGYILFADAADRADSSGEPTSLETRSGWAPGRLAKKILKAKLYDGADGKKWARTVADVDGIVLVTGVNAGELAVEIEKGYSSERVVVLDETRSPFDYVNDGPFSMLFH